VKRNNTLVESVSKALSVERLAQATNPPNNDPSKVVNKITNNVIGKPFMISGNAPKTFEMS